MRGIYLSFGLVLVQACDAGASAQQEANAAELARIATSLEALQSDVAVLRAETDEKKLKEQARVERRESLRESSRERRSKRGSSSLKSPFGPDSGSKPVDIGEPQPLPITQAARPAPKEPSEDSKRLAAVVESVKCEDGRCTMDRSALEQILQSPELLMRQARVVPSMQDGQSKGFKLYGIRPRSLFKALGFKNGDMISSVNGEDLTSVDHALELYTKLRDANEFEFGIQRRGMRYKHLVVLE